MSYEYWTDTRGGGSTAVKTRARRARRTETSTPKPGGAALASSARTRTVAQIFAGVVGAVFVLVGILGFVPGIVRMFGDFSFLGPDSHAKLLGLFEVSAAHNIVHLLFGVGLVAAKRSSWAVRYLLIGGVAYLAVFVYGLAVVDSTSRINFLPVNTADNVLHLALSLGMIALGIVSVVVLRRTPAKV